MDFLLTEGFWMEAIITACISAAAVIIAGMMIWNYYLRKLVNDVKEVKDQANERRTEHEKLSREHQYIRDNMSREHQYIRDNMSREHQYIRDNMSQEYMDIKSDITQILILLQSFKR